MQTIVIIGNGISGITLARNVRKHSSDRIIIISAETKYFYSRPALMYIYMGHMKFENTKPYEDWFWQKNNIELVFEKAVKIDTNENFVLLESQEKIKFDKLVLATGSHPRLYNWPGIHLNGIQGLYSYQDLLKMEENTKHIKNAVVTGGGLIGVEMVEMLVSRGIHVTYLVREFKFWNRILPNEEANLLENHIQKHNVDLRLNNEVTEVHGNQQNVSYIVTQNKEQIKCEFLGVCVGVEPNIDLAINSNIKTKKGILVNEYFETNCKNVYAIGDCAEQINPLTGRPPVEQIWYTGKMQGFTLAHTLTGKPTPYQPGNFYNSAKIFDIEYHVYSRNMIMEKELDSIVYINSKEEKSIRVFFNKESHRFEGITVLGIRYRHEVCDKWLSEDHDVKYILQHLTDANFDPEFYHCYEEELVKRYNQKFNTTIHLQKLNKKRIFGVK